MKQNSLGNVRPLQIIVSAMMAGLAVFGIIVLIVGSAMEPDARMSGILLAVLGAMGAMEVIGYLVLRTLLVGKLRRDSDRQPIGQAGQPDAEQYALAAWSTLTLIRSAMAEGWGLFGGVIALATGSAMGLAAMVIALVLLAAGFPTQDRLTQFTSDITGRNPYAA